MMANAPSAMDKLLKRIKDVSQGTPGNMTPVRLTIEEVVDDIVDGFEEFFALGGTVDQLYPIMHKSVKELEEGEDEG